MPKSAWTEKDQIDNFLKERRLNTSAGNPVKEILLKLNLPDHRILKDGGKVQAKGTSLSLKSMITTPYLLEKEKKMKSASTRMKTQHSSSVELFGFLSLLIIMSVDDADDSISNNSDKSNENLNVVSTELYASQIYSKTAYDMWIDLKDTYDKDDGSVIFNLHKNINSLNQNGSSLSEYYHNLNSLWKQFDAMISLPPCTCEVAKHYENHANQIKLMQFLMGLDDTYQPIRSNILIREPLPLVKTDFTIVSGEESHRNVTYMNNASKHPLQLPLM
ncbi:ribonuclease H-like domain-containing protein [Tanacetum coccineum]